MHSFKHRGGAWRLGLLLAALSVPAQATTGPVEVAVFVVHEHGHAEPLGVVRLEDSAQGLVLRPELVGLPPGPLRLQVHERASCAPLERDGQRIAAGAAGRRHDPPGRLRARGPEAESPTALRVNAQGAAEQAVMARGWRLADARGRSLLLLAGTERRLACGVIPSPP